MRQTTITIAALLCCAALPLVAQGGDETAKVTGSGKLPPGWMVRFDPPNPRFARPGAPAPSLTDISLVTMGTGFHVTSGPAALYYRTADQGSGVYAFTATFHQGKSMVHESYGIFIGGSNLQDATEDYLYMVIRPSDGHMSIEHRKGNASPVSLVPMRTDSSDAINKDSPTDGSATNTLMIHVAPDTVHFFINGKLVKAIAKSALDGASTNGQAGLRVNHNISVHVSDIAIKK